MYKTISIAAISLAVFAFTSNSGTASPTSRPSPVIMAKGRVLSRSVATPATVVFTPNDTGLYRLSVYGTISNPCPSNCQQWFFNLSWTDDAGTEASNGSILSWSNGNTQPSAFAYNNASNGTPWPGNAVVFEAVGGSPVAYSVTGIPDGSSYSLYYVIERLE